jgi:hypothetical protein
MKFIKIRKKKKSREEKIREKRQRMWFYGFLFIFLVLALFFLQHKIEKEREEILFPQEREINLSRYKQATFSDSFSGDGWLDMEKTNLFFDKTNRRLVYALEEKNLEEASLAEIEPLKLEPQEVVSKPFNFSVREIKAVQITRTDNNPGDGKINYYFSNNDGENWYLMSSSEPLIFKETGNSLRWKARVMMLDDYREEDQVVPEISSIFIKYWYQR